MADGLQSIYVNKLLLLDSVKVSLSIKPASYLDSPCFWITIVFGHRAHLIRGHLSSFHGKAYFKKDKNNSHGKDKIYCRIENEAFFEAINKKVQYFLVAS